MKLDAQTVILLLAAWPLVTMIVDALVVPFLKPRFPRAAIVVAYISVNLDGLVKKLREANEARKP